MQLELPSSHNDSRPEETDDDDDDAFVKPSKLSTQETQTSLDQNLEQYHPPADKLKVRKNRHRRTSSHGSPRLGSPRSPRLSPMRERRISGSSPRRSQGSYADLESYDPPDPQPIRFFHHAKSTSSLNGNLTATSPEAEIFPKRFSSSSSSEAEEIDHDVDADDDILETLDRKVSEVINRSRLNSSNNSMQNTSDKYGPLSFSYNKKNSPSPNRRLSPMATSGMVRFGSDEEDNAGGHLTDDSSDLDDHSDDEDRPKPVDLDGTVNNAVFMMRKR